MLEDVPTKVLVVDDDPTIVEMLQDIFHQAGFSHDGAAGGGEALEKLASGTFDAVVLDAVMPDISGPEVMRRLRRSTIERPAIVYFTAYPDISAYDTFLGGADAVLIKPRPSEELVDTVRYLAGKRRRRLAHEVDADVARHRLEKAGRYATISEVTARLCHDLKNPIAAATGFAIALKRDLQKLEDGGAAFVAKVEKIDTCIERVNKHLDDLMSVISEMEDAFQDGPIGNDRHDYEKTPRTFVKQVVDETAALLRSAIAARGISLYLNPIADDFIVSMPPTALQLVLRQLIVNACEAVIGRDERWLRLDVERVHSDIVITVSDSGLGVPPTERERIMEPFYRGKPEDAAAGNSNWGLGLAIARRTTARFGGVLELALGDGPTKFILRVPAARLPNKH